MPKYRFGRRVQIKRYIPQLPYESVEFYIEDAKTKKEAVDEVEKWIDKYFKDKKKQLEKISKKIAKEAKKIAKENKTPEERFIEELGEYPEPKKTKKGPECRECKKPFEVIYIKKIPASIFCTPCVRNVQREARKEKIEKDRAKRESKK